MDIDALLDALEAVYSALGDRVKNTPFLYHFRITTSGGTRAGLTHPFPLSNKAEKLTKTHLQTDVAICHNGIIDIDIETGLSDTASYIKNEMYALKGLSRYFYKNKAVQDSIKHRIGSKMAILDTTGETVTIGKFETDENGLMYSNDSYKPYTYPKKAKTFDYGDFLSDYNDYYCYARTDDKTSQKRANKPTGLFYRINTKKRYTVVTTTGDYSDGFLYVSNATDIVYIQYAHGWYDCGYFVDIIDAWNPNVYTGLDDVSELVTLQ